MNMSNDKTTENRLRRQLSRQGYTLMKTPAQSWMRQHYPVGYTVQSQNGIDVLGTSERGFEATLEDVQEFVFWLLDSNDD